MTRGDTKTVAGRAGQRLRDISVPTLFDSRLCSNPELLSQCSQPGQQGEAATAAFVVPAPLCCQGSRRVWARCVPVKWGGAELEAECLLQPSLAGWSFCAVEWEMALPLPVLSCLPHRVVLGKAHLALRACTAPVNLCVTLPTVNRPGVRRGKQGSCL